MVSQNSGKGKIRGSTRISQPEQIVSVPLAINEADIFGGAFGENGFSRYKLMINMKHEMAVDCIGINRQVKLPSRIPCALCFLAGVNPGITLIGAVTSAVMAMKSGIATNGVTQADQIKRSFMKHSRG